jgi:hypothetical protein
MYMAGKLLFALLISFPLIASSQAVRTNSKLYSQLVKMASFGTITSSSFDTLPPIQTGQAVLSPVDSTGYRHYLNDLIGGARDFDYTFYTLKCRMPVGLLDGTDSLLELAWPRRIRKEGDRLSICNLMNTGDCLVYNIIFLGSIIKDDYPVLFYVTDPERNFKQQSIIINPMFGTVVVDSTTSFY